MRAFPGWIDILVTFLLVGIWKLGWDRLRLTDEQWTILKGFDERQLAATAIQNQAVAAMTVVSIIFVAIGALLGQSTQIDRNAKRHLRAAAVLCVTSLVMGIWIIGSLPVQVNFYNVAYDHWLALLSVAQLTLTLLAALRVTLGISRLLA
jgi:hypothetical protein